MKLKRGLPLLNDQQDILLMDLQLFNVTFFFDSKVILSMWSHLCQH